MALLMIMAIIKTMITKMMIRRSTHDNIIMMSIIKHKTCDIERFPFTSNSIDSIYSGSNPSITKAN